METQIADFETAQAAQDMGGALSLTGATGISRLNDVMQQAGHAADQAAARHAFDSHTSRKADNTIRRKIADLALFETFLQSVNVPAAGLYEDPQAWAGVTYGLVEAFREWQLKQGYAISSINGRLSTVRTFAKLAMQAGTIKPEPYMLIASVKGYDSKEAKHIDDKRKAEGKAIRKAERMNNGKLTRTGKKSKAVTIPEDIAEALTRQPDNPQGRRDALLMCLMLEHGLRVGEIAILTRQSFDLEAGTFTFDRPKVNKIQTHVMSPNTRKAAAAYINQDAPADGILWRKSCKGTGKLSSQMSETSATRAITKRVELLGRHAGIDGLSAHDCRHYWTTWELNHGTSEAAMMDAGGWNSPAMVHRYRDRGRIANAGTARLR